MHGTQRMVKTRMQRTGINQVGHAQLLNIPQPLKVRMLNKVEHQFRRDADKAVNRVVYNLLFIQSVVMQAKMKNKGNKRVVYLLIFVNVANYQ